MITLQKAQVILAQSFFCTKAIECETAKASMLLRSFRPIPYSAKKKDKANAKATAEEYNASPVNNPPQETLDKCRVFKYLGDDTRIYDQIWTEIISEF